MGKTIWNARRRHKLERRIERHQRKIERAMKILRPLLRKRRIIKYTRGRDGRFTSSEEDSDTDTDESTDDDDDDD
jgi:hypothetical protein